MTPEERFRFLEAQVRHLSLERQEALTAMELAAGLGSFGTSLNKLTDPIPILQETTIKIRSLFKFKAICFFLVDENDSNFTPALCHPQEDFSFVSDEVEKMIEEGTFAWCLGRNRPHITTARSRKETLIIHTLATFSRIRGIFVGVLGQERFSISDSSMNLFTILIHACAQKLESFELYAWNRRIVEEMQNTLNEQQTLNNVLELQVQEVTQQLDTVKKELAIKTEKSHRDANKFRETEMTLRRQTKVNNVLHKLIRQFIESTSLDAYARYAAQAAATLTGSVHAFACWVDTDNQTICLPALDNAIIRHFSLHQHQSLQKDSLPGDWGKALLAGKTYCRNEPVDAFPLQQGVKKTLGPKRLLSVPVLDFTSPVAPLIGHITLSNAPRPYNSADVQDIERIAALFALSLRKTL